MPQAPPSRDLFTLKTRTHADTDGRRTKRPAVGACVTAPRAHHPRCRLFLGLVGADGTYDAVVPAYAADGQYRDGHEDQLGRAERALVPFDGEEL